MQLLSPYLFSRPVRLSVSWLSGWLDLQTISKFAQKQNETLANQSPDLNGDCGCTHENHRKRLCAQALCNPGWTGHTVIKMDRKREAAQNVIRNWLESVAVGWVLASKGWPALLCWTQFFTLLLFTKHVLLSSSLSKLGHVCLRSKINCLLSSVPSIVHMLCNLTLASL
jgi:hypothetical protein